MTYDEQQQTYRYWWFNSDGNTIVSTGTWDEKTKTFTWTSPAVNGISATMTDHFVDNNTREWNVLVKDANGDVVFEMSGKSAKRKA